MSIDFSKHIVKQYACQAGETLNNLAAFVVGITAPPNTRIYFDTNNNSQPDENGIENGICIGPLGVYQFELTNHQYIQSIAVDKYSAGNNEVIIDTIEYAIS